MGRKKGYERAELTAAALELFHAHGFAGASTEMLVERLGVNRNSMYAEFGSKQGLFEAALAHYEAEVFDALFGPLEVPGAGLASVEALFASFGPGARRGAGLGCLLCNTAVEFAGAEPGGGRFVERYFERVQGAFKHALTNARTAGELTAEADLVDEAGFLTATALGIFVMVRARATPQAVRSATRAVARHLGGLGGSRRAVPAAAHLPERRARSTALTSRRNGSG